MSTDSALRVMVTGAGGQLGRALVDTLSAAAEVHAYTRESLDVGDDEAVRSEVARVAPGLLINASAYTDVDGAEEHHVQALRVNGTAVGVLARAARGAGATFVHYSTDFVFAGRENRMWTEADLPEPQGVYAQSKLVGEWLAADCPRHFILRVESLFGGARRKSTIDRIVSTLRAGGEMRLFHDRTVSPSFVDDVVRATWQLVQSDAAPGVYHCVNSGATTWLGIGQAVAARLSLDPRLLVPTSLSAVPMRASRPQYAALDNSKLHAAGVPMPAWDDALTRYLTSKGA